MDQEYGAREQDVRHQAVRLELHPNARELDHVRDARPARERGRGTRPDPRTDPTAAHVPPAGRRLHQAGRQHDRVLKGLPLLHNNQLQEPSLHA